MWSEYGAMRHWLNDTCGEPSGECSWLFGQKHPNILKLYTDYRNMSYLWRINPLSFIVRFLIQLVGKKSNLSKSFPFYIKYLGIWEKSRQVFPGNTKSFSETNANIKTMLVQRPELFVSIFNILFVTSHECIFPFIRSIIIPIDYTIECVLLGIFMNFTWFLSGKCGTA